VTLTDKDNRANQLRLVRDPHTGDIWAEVQARHNGVEVFSALRLGQLWELLPRLAKLT
jgi:hypothetical protein